MRKLFAILLIAATLWIGFGCTGNSRTLKEIGAELNLNLLSGTIVIEEDSHSGFHGDGRSFIAIQFADDELVSQLALSDNWFSLDETAQALLYGYRDEENGNTRQYGPYIVDEAGQARFPQMQNGYYWLTDRQSGNEKDGKTTDWSILLQPSLNFTIAVYDLDANILYYAKMDT